MAKLESLFPINFSPSMMEDVWRCDLFFFREHCLKLVGANQKKNSDLIAGSLFSQACERTRNEYYNNGLTPDDAINAGYELILGGEDTGDTDKTNEVVARSFKKYFKTFPLNSTLTPVALSDGTHAVEYDVLIDLGIPHPDLPGRTICYRVKLDMLANNIVYGKDTGVYVVDEKSTGALKRLKGTKEIDFEAEKSVYLNSGQFIDYHWAARVLGVKTKGTLVRKVPLLKNHEDAFELPIPISEWQIKHRIASVYNKINELIERYTHWKETGCAPQSAFDPVYSSSCTAFKRPCKFTSGCMSEDGEKEMYSTFIQKAYDSETKSLMDLREFKLKLLGG
jgi:hypothetical protein